MHLKPLFEEDIISTWNVILKNYGVEVANALVKAGKLKSRQHFPFDNLILTLVYGILIEEKVFAGFMFTLSLHINL